MTPEATRDEVVAALRSLGLRASHEFPGYISIPANDGAEYAVGSMNGPWQIDHKTLGGDVTSLDGHLPEDRAAPEVAIWIKQSIAAGDRPEAPPPAAWATASSPVAEGTQRGRRDDVIELAPLEELCRKVNSAALRKSEAWDTLHRAEARAREAMEPLTTRSAVEARLAYEMASHEHESIESKYRDAVRAVARNTNAK